MRAWISDKFRASPWLATAVVLYLALSVVEITRVALLADPVDEDDVGFSRWREIPAPGSGEARLLFRWSEPRSSMHRPIEAPVMGLTLYRPDDAHGEVDIAFTLDGNPLDTYTVGVAGLYSFYYYLPPMLASGKWVETQARWAERELERARRAEGGWFARWQELKPWSRPPEPPSIRIDAVLDPVPEPGVAEADAVAAPGGTEPALFVGIAPVEWRGELPDDGAGFHASETAPDGTSFRWSRRWASLPLETAGSAAVLRLRALHPDIADNPVSVSLYWNDELRRTVNLASPDWTVVALPLAPPGATGVLTIHVDRTWSPAGAGISRDRRELGVAVGEIVWR